jgi:hypothetical protein
MRIKLAIPVLLVAVLAACGGGTASSVNPSAGGTASSVSPSAGGSQASISQPPQTSAPSGKGKVDCTAINAATKQLLMVQLLAQLRTPDAVGPIKAGQMGNLDLDAFLASMHELHALDAYASPLGDPKVAIDRYEKAAAAAKVLFATDPITQPAIDTYLQTVGTIAEFIGNKTAIVGAVSAAGC